MQQILNGIHTLHGVLEGCKKILLVCDSSFSLLNIKQEIEDIPFSFVIFNQFTPNPLYEDVSKGVDMFNEEHCDTILAVGGGSTIDVAKCIKLFCKMSKDKLYLEQEYKDTGIKLIAIPTTAGTGSESTRYAVVYYDDKKQSITHDSIIPNVAILEPKLLKTLPLYQKKCTMMDALCQGIESWWSVNSTDKSKLYSKTAVETIIKWWREYIFENTDESAKQIMTAANDAGHAICIAQTTAPHAFSYKITSLFGLPHGHAVAICLPEIWQYMIDNMENCLEERDQDYLSSIFIDISHAMRCETIAEAINKFRQIMIEMELYHPKANNRAKELAVLSSSVNPIRLKNNPVSLNDTAIHYIYERILI